MLRVFYFYFAIFLRYFRSRSCRKTHESRVFELLQNLISRYLNVLRKIKWSTILQKLWNLPDIFGLIGTCKSYILCYILHVFSYTCLKYHVTTVLLLVSLTLPASIFSLFSNVWECVPIIAEVIEVSVKNFIKHRYKSASLSADISPFYLYHYSRSSFSFFSLFYLFLSFFSWPK